jgi:hypothetical protein
MTTSAGGVDDDGRLHFAHADVDLQLVDNSEARSLAAGIAERRRAAGQLVCGDLAIARALREAVDRLGQTDEREPIRVPHDRHEQAALGLHRDADVDARALDDRVADDRRVHAREIAQRAHRRRDRERQIGETEAVRSNLLGPVAQPHKRESTSATVPTCGETTFDTTMCSAMRRRMAVNGMTLSSGATRCVGTRSAVRKSPSVTGAEALDAPAAGADCGCAAACARASG